MSIRVRVIPTNNLSHYFQQKNLNLITSFIAGFAKVCCGVYGISFIRFLSPLSVLQKQVITIVPTQGQQKCIYTSSCEVLPSNSQSDVKIRYRSLLSLLI